MMDGHPSGSVTRLRELVEQWRDEAFDLIPDDDYPCPCDIDDARDQHIATQAARWGADQELEACCEQLAQLVRGDRMAEYLRITRRPKPLSLKQQALDVLKHARDGWAPVPTDWDIIRRALETVDD